jgi:hypothetical protein
MKISASKHKFLQRGLPEYILYTMNYKPQHPVLLDAAVNCAPKVTFHKATSRSTL